MFVWISTGPSSSYRVSKDLEKLKKYLTEKYSLKGVEVVFDEKEFSTVIDVGMLGDHIASEIGHIYKVEEL